MASVSEPAASGTDLTEMLTGTRIPSPRVRAVLDAVLILWVAGWIVLGVVVGREVQGLESLADTTVTAGRALDSAGSALGAVGNLPLVGGDFGRVAEQTRDAGRMAIESGRESHDSIHDLSILLAFAVAVVPSLPYVLLYLPIRLAWRRLAPQAGTSL